MHSFTLSNRKDTLTYTGKALLVRIAPAQRENAAVANGNNRENEPRQTVTMSALHLLIYMTSVFPNGGGIGSQFRRCRSSLTFAADTSRPTRGEGGTPFFRCDSYSKLVPRRPLEGPREPKGKGHGCFCCLGEFACRHFRLHCCFQATIGA